MQSSGLCASDTWIDLCEHGTQESTVHLRRLSRPFASSPVSELACLPVDLLLVKTSSFPAYFFPSE